MILRPYQKEGESEIFSAWKTDDILMFVLATGGGKTVTFVEVITKLLLQGKRVLLIAHREELILQAWHTLQRAYIHAGIIMADYPQKYELPVQVCSIQTIRNRKNLPPADVLIIDEAHHVTRENSYGKIIARYSSAKVLLVTATPCRLSGEGFEYLHPYKKTKLIVNRTLKQLIEEGYLVPFRYFLASIPDLSEIATSKGEYEEESAHSAMQLAPITESYLEHCPGKSGICFAVNVKHSIEIAGRYHYAGVPAAHLDGTTPKEERRRIISDFRAQLVKVIVNVGILTEGADFPSADFAQHACPTKSLTKFLQCNGRAGRPLSGLIEGIESQAERLNRIKQSAKPYGIILDNAGCWLDHGLPDKEIDWNAHFIGAKKKKKEEGEIEILVYVGEDEKGNRKRTKNPKEIEGMRLVEITTEQKPKILNIVSIKEFDKIFGFSCGNPTIKRPASYAFNTYLDNCRQRKIEIPAEVFEYIRKKIVIGPLEKKRLLQENFALNPGVYPPQMLAREIDKIDRLGVNSQWFTKKVNEFNAGRLKTA